MRQVVILIISLLFAVTVQGQQLVVKSMTMEAGDLSASTQRRLSPDGKPCALLKIQTVEIITGVDGDVAVGNLQRIGTTTWIYVPAGIFGITIKTEKNETIDINFDDYGYDQVNSLSTYAITLVDKRQLVLDEKDNPTDARKQYQLAMDYELSRNGRPKSATQTKRWMTAAAQQGLPEAMYGLGRYYAREEHDTVTAVQWMEQAAEKGDAEIQYHTAELILKYHVEDSLVKMKALPLMERAARQDYVAAIEGMCNIYQWGLWPTDIDHEKAVYWYEQLSAKGVAEADYQLGWLHSISANSKVRSLNKARKWYRSAAKKGLDKANRRLEELKRYKDISLPK